MQFTIVALFAAGMAVAVPTWDKTTSSAAPASTNSGIENQPACCNPDSNSQGGLIGGIADGLLDIDCTLNIAGSTCSANQVSANCPVDKQTGLIVVGSVCAPINVA